MESLKEAIATLESSLLKQESSTGNRPSFEPKCSICGDEGYIPLEGLDRTWKECVCVAEKRVQRKLPQRYRSASLLDFSQSWRDAAMAWLERPADGLLITGKAGVGKTRFAAAMVRTLILIHQDVCFERCADFYSRLREAIRMKLPEEAAFADFCKSRFMFLDDLGAGSLSDHERRSTLELLDRRLNKELPTCVTTNWTIEEIAEKIDERIASRLQSFTQLALDGPDRRAR